MIEEISGDFLQWLRGFYFVAERGSVRQAAIAMSREQPTISRQIQCLEKELGVTLFDRSSGKMTITPEGKILQQEAVALFEDIKRIKGEFTDQKRDYQGTIVIVTTHAIVDTILPPYIDRFMKLHPQVVFHLEGSIRETVYEKIESGEADFGIAVLDKPPNTIVCHDFYETGLVMIAPKKNSFFPGKSPTLRQIAQAPLILFAHRGSLEPLIEGRFAKERLKPNVVMTHNNFVSMKRFVAYGMGVAILGAHAISREDEKNFDIYSLDKFFPKRKYRILLKKKKYLSGMVKAFILSIKPDIDFSVKPERSDRPDAESALTLTQILRGPADVLFAGDEAVQEGKG